MLDEPHVADVDRPGPCDSTRRLGTEEEDLHRDHQEGKDEEWQAKPQKAALQEGGRPFVVTRRGREEAGDEEEEAHEEGTVHGEEGTEQCRASRLLDRPRATGRPVGLAHVVRDQEARQGNSQIVEIVETFRGGHGLGPPDAKRFHQPFREDS